MLDVDLQNITTEQINQQTTSIDRISVIDQLKLMNSEDDKVAKEVRKAIPEIAVVIEKAIKVFQSGGHLIYLGAGTSGRLGILDAVECVPTFGVSPDMVTGLIAGGEQAIMEAVEGAEDSEVLGKEDLQNINIKKNDMVIGLSASGRTPYVAGGLNYANSIGAETVAISCNLNAKLSSIAKNKIEVDCGPEVITGSTRLKAGTAEKMILNMISTLSMVGIGKVYGNLMVDLKPTNEKLVERSKRIIMEVTDVSYKEAEKYYELSGSNVKIAIIMALTGSTMADAQEKLENAKGFVSKALEEDN